MEQDENLNFDFKVADKTTIDLEKKIKSYLRRYSVNISMEKDVERYSDRYSESVLVNEENIKKYVIPSILPEELAVFFGAESNAELEELGSVDSLSGNEFGSEELGSEERDSEDIDDDYRIKVDDDDGITSEEDEQQEGFL